MDPRLTIPEFPCPICGTPTAHLFCSEICARRFSRLGPQTKQRLYEPDITLADLEDKPHA
ncbi:MAG: hypothetical protein JW709_00370 [Sedimentisphaerales bacterium]|nr:hypothetical protein [Sedimentisphaerales bacterium]